MAGTTRDEALTLPMDEATIAATVSPAAKFVIPRNFFRAPLFTVLLVLLPFSTICLAVPSDKHSDRPKLPYNMMGLGHDELDAYDSKAEPVASATAALLALNRAGWELIHKYFPKVGIAPDAEGEAHAQGASEARFVGTELSEDAVLSPIPLMSAIWSLPDSELSGRLKALHDELATAMTLEDYSQWKLDALRSAVDGMTEWTKTGQGTRYRKPRNNVSFRQALQLYAMTVTLIRSETKWAGKTDNPPPNMADFANRLSHQLPQKVEEGRMTWFFLYRPGVFDRPLNKDEFEERADVVALQRHGHIVEAQQLPVYLTVDEKEWAPSWIEPKDEQVDSTLAARKYEHDWTRLDGPYLWYRSDQLDGAVLYRATAQLLPDHIVIEAERSIESRGSVKRVDRPPDYNPALMPAFSPGVDTPAGPYDALMVDPMSLDEQVRGLKSIRHYSNAFKAWCLYGLSTSGMAGDGRTWISVLPDEPRQTNPLGQSSSAR